MGISIILNTGATVVLLALIIAGVSIYNDQKEERIRQEKSSSKKK